MPNNLFCFGYGYVAKALSYELQDKGFSCVGTSRQPHPGAHVICFDENNPVSRDILWQHSHVLISISPQQNEDLVLEKHRQDLIDHPNLKWVGYLSSTSVYGDWQGQWVDESSDCRAQDPIELPRLKAENDWLSLYHEFKVPVHIFRLSGIYGPDRNMVDRVLEGVATRIDKQGQFFSRIHVEDIVQVLIASMSSINPGRTYNLADDEPCDSKTVAEFVCDQLGLPYPPLQNFETAHLSPMAQRFYKNNRRVKNQRIKEELGIHLKFPTYKEGLRAYIEAAKAKINRKSLHES